MRRIVQFDESMAQKACLDFARVQVQTLASPLEDA